MPARRGSHTLDPQANLLQIEKDSCSSGPAVQKKKKAFIFLNTICKKARLSDRNNSLLPLVTRLGSCDTHWRKEAEKEKKEQGTRLPRVLCSEPDLLCDLGRVTYSLCVSICKMERLALPSHAGAL